MKPGASAGRIPANVSLSERPRVMAGLANEVEEVNQYAAPIHAGTRHAASLTDGEEKATSTRPPVATSSASHCAAPVRVWVDASMAASPNMRLASTAPAAHPRICATT